MFASTKWQALSCPDGLACSRRPACHFSHHIEIDVRNIKRARDESDAASIAIAVGAPSGEELTAEERERREAHHEQQAALAEHNARKLRLEQEAAAVASAKPRAVRAPDAPPEISAVHGATGTLRPTRWSYATRQIYVNEAFAALRVLGLDDAGASEEALRSEEQIYTQSMNETMYRNECVEALRQLRGALR